MRQTTLSASRGISSRETLTLRREPPKTPTEPKKREIPQTNLDLLPFCIFWFGVLDFIWFFPFIFIKLYMSRLHWIVCYISVRCMIFSFHFLSVETHDEKYHWISIRSFAAHKSLMAEIPVVIYYSSNEWHWMRALFPLLAKRTSKFTWRRKKIVCGMNDVPWVGCFIFFSSSLVGSRLRIGEKNMCHCYCIWYDLVNRRDPTPSFRSFSQSSSQMQITYSQSILHVAISRLLYIFLLE